jgi:hypothetical protein
VGWKGPWTQTVISPPHVLKCNALHFGARGTWRSWLRDCATSCKVSGSIPDGIFHWHNPSDYGHGVDSASNRNEYQEYFLGRKGGWCVRLTVLSRSCADCLEFWEPLPPGTLWACNRPGQGLLYFYFTFRDQDESPSSGLLLSRQWSLHGNYLYSN